MGSLRVGAMGNGRLRGDEKCEGWGLCAMGS